MTNLEQGMHEILSAIREEMRHGRKLYGVIESDFHVAYDFQSQGYRIAFKANGRRTAVNITDDLLTKKQPHEIAADVVRQIVEQTYAPRRENVEGWGSW